MPLFIACQELFALALPDWLENARVCLTLLEEHARQFHTHEANAALFEARGLLMLTEMNSREAAEYFRQAAAEWETIDRRYDLARAEYSLGQAIQAAGDASGASAEYNRAIDIFNSLAAQLDPELKASFLHSPLVQAVQLASADLARQNPTQNRPIRSTPELGVLTEREVEVLKLVAQGLKNAQIAEKLVLSPLTVNTHLRSIFNKLDVTTRTAAVHQGIERGFV